MAVEWVAGSSWNQWPDVHGIDGRMPVESAVQVRESLRSGAEKPGGSILAAFDTLDMLMLLSIAYRAGRGTTGSDCS
jgi:hypothetical protein